MKLSVSLAQILRHAVPQSQEDKDFLHDLWEWYAEALDLARMHDNLYLGINLDSLKFILGEKKR